VNKVYVPPSGPPKGPDEPRLYYSEDGFSGSIENRGRTRRAERYLGRIMRLSGAFAMSMNDAPDNHGMHGPFETMEAAFAWWVENHDAPPLSTVSVGGTYTPRRSTTSSGLNEWGFSDVAAKTVPDDDPAVIEGMEHAAEARREAVSLPEYRFGRRMRS
jgi:hypothetical protein